MGRDELLHLAREDLGDGEDAFIDASQLSLPRSGSYGKKGKQFGKPGYECVLARLGNANDFLMILNCLMQLEEIRQEVAASDGYTRIAAIINQTNSEDVKSAFMFTSLEIIA